MIEYVCVDCEVGTCKDCALFGEHKLHEVKKYQEGFESVAERFEENASSYRERFMEFKKRRKLLCDICQEK